MWDRLKKTLKKLILQIGKKIDLNFFNKIKNKNFKSKYL